MSVGRMGFARDVGNTSPPRGGENVRSDRESQLLLLDAEGEFALETVAH